MPDPTEVLNPAGEPPADAIPVDAGALAALDAALEAGDPDPLAKTPPADPQPGDPLPPPDNAPRAPEGDGETDPDDNAPHQDPPKPDDGKTVVPTDPAADDPKVEPKPEGDGMQKKPSDEFGELGADVPAKTRERFDTLKGKYDEVHERLTVAEAQSRQWVETVQRTGANPEQFGMALAYLSDVNSGTPEGLQRAYEVMSAELAVLAKALGKPVNGVFDPLDLPENADLKRRVEEEALDRAGAEELAQARAARRLAETSTSTRDAATEAQQAADRALANIAAFGAERKANDPQYAAKMQVLGPVVKRVVAQLPPEKWEDEIKALYAEVQVATPAPAAPARVVPDTLRPTSAPGAGGGIVKEPKSALEAMNAVLP